MIQNPGLSIGSSSSSTAGWKRMLLKSHSSDTSFTTQIEYDLNSPLLVADIDRLVLCIWSNDVKSTGGISAPGTVSARLMTDEGTYAQVASFPNIINVKSFPYLDLFRDTGSTWVQSCYCYDNSGCIRQAYVGTSGIYNMTSNAGDTFTKLVLTYPSTTSSSATIHSGSVISFVAHYA